MDSSLSILLYHHTTNQRGIISAECLCQPAAGIKRRWDEEVPELVKNFINLNGKEFANCKV